MTIDPRQASTRPGGRALMWGALLAVIGVVLEVIGGALLGGGATKSEVLLGGTMQGVGGLLIVVALLAVVVGLVRRFKAP